MYTGQVQFRSNASCIRFDHIIIVVSGNTLVLGGGSSGSGSSLLLGGLRGLEELPIVGVSDRGYHDDDDAL